MRRLRLREGKVTHLVQSHQVGGAGLGLGVDLGLVCVSTQVYAR